MSPGNAPPIEFPLDLEARNGERERGREGEEGEKDGRKLEDLSSDFPVFVVELAYGRLLPNRDIPIVRRNWINDVIALPYAYLSDSAVVSGEICN